MDSHRDRTQIYSQVAHQTEKTKAICAQGLSITFVFKHFNNCPGFLVHFLLVLLMPFSEQWLLQWLHMQKSLSMFWGVV